MTTESGPSGVPPTPSLRKRAVKLESARDCRKLLSKIINAVHRGELPPSQGAKLGYLLSVLIRSFEEAESRWAEAETSPSPATLAARIRQCMRQANDLVPPPPGGAE